MASAPDSPPDPDRREIQRGGNEGEGGGKPGEGDSKQGEGQGDKQSEGDGKQGQRQQDKSYGALDIERYVKDDGRMLIIYSRPERGE
jgi:hypothetical protein